MKIALAYLAAALGLLALFGFQILLAIWLWEWIGTLVTLQWLLQGALTLVGWLAITSAVAFLAMILEAFGSVIGSAAAALIGGGLVWFLIGVAWQALVVGYAMGFHVYRKARKLERLR